MSETAAPEFSGAGRYFQDGNENPQWGFGYGGMTNGPNDYALGAGLGVYKGDHSTILSATGELGVWSSEAGGEQAGLHGEATSIGLNGSLGEIMNGLLGYDAPESKEGGWENFLSGEVHGPEARGELSAGTAGIQAEAQAEMIGGSLALGGAEYDWFGGTEIEAGLTAGGAGGNGGLSWGDEDGDGLREYGFHLGGEEVIGGDIGIKTELPGHMYNAAMSAYDWVTGG